MRTDARRAFELERFPPFSPKDHRVAEKTVKTITLVTPCFNEELNIRECYEAVRILFDGELSGYRREHIFCDNASTDRTLPILREIACADPSVKIIVNRRNFGPLKNTYNGLMASS